MIARAKQVTHHSISIHLRQNNLFDTCDNLLNRVSDPHSATYGQYYSFDAIRQLTWDQEAIDSVQDYLVTHGIPLNEQELAPNGEYIRIKTSTERIEKMFSAKFYHFTSMERKQALIRSESYTIPTHLSNYIRVINGIRNFPVYSKHTKLAGLMQKRQSDGTVTPQLIWKTYNMPNETDATPLADQSVFESLGQSYSPDDLKQFQQQYNLPIQPVKKVIGKNDPSACISNPDDCGEANLDVQYMMAMAQGSPTIYWSVPSDGDIFYHFIEQVAKDKSPPQVFSISYGGPEHLQNLEDVVLFNTETCKMGLRGLTLFASSGDDGVAGPEARGNSDNCAFNPTYPAECPYITSVGATMGPESGGPEVACQSDKGSLITTGGGFSNVFPQPQWQSNAVKRYLRSGNLPPSNMYNQSGRGYPDVAALGNNYHVIIGGQDYKVSGTSASSPVFCAMVTLVNGDREAAGKSPLGFINPLLYQLSSSVYNDITSGENNCCAAQGNPTCCAFGFKCAAGWDPVTGLGSIDFTQFANALASL